MLCAATVEVGVDHVLNCAFELVDDFWRTAGVAGLGLGFVSQASPPLVLLGEGSRLVYRQWHKPAAHGAAAAELLLAGHRVVPPLDVERPQVVELLLRVGHQGERVELHGSRGFCLSFWLSFVVIVVGFGELVPAFFFDSIGGTFW
jgi:hypothetical protein